MVKSYSLLLFCLIMAIFFTSYHPYSKSISSSSIIEKLQDEIYYFPAKEFGSSDVVYQPLERFDLIFVGHNATFDNRLLNLSYIIPGRYTHVLSYLGKDDDGFAYAIEMNADKNQTFTIDFDGLHVGGGVYLYCLGDDFSKRSCPLDKRHIYGMDTYDYMFAKRLKPKLKKRLMMYETQLMQTMREDLIRGYPFQVPFEISLETVFSKSIPLVEYGRKNGADCVSYFVSLFEEVAHVCMDNIRIDASTLSSYYIDNKLGKSATLPAKYNFLSHETTSFNRLFSDLEYKIIDTPYRETSCLDKRVVRGVPTPDLLFNSSSLVEINSSSGHH